MYTYLLSCLLCRYRSGLVGTSRAEQLSNPAIAVRPNSFLSFQADYERVKAVTYSLQAYVQFQACYSDDVPCLKKLPSCSESPVPTDPVTDMTGSGASGEGVKMLAEQGEAGGDDTSDQERELYSSGDSGMYEDANFRKNRYFYKIARQMPNTVSTCVSSKLDLSRVSKTQNETSPTTPTDTSDWDYEFTLFIQTDNATVSTSLGSRNAGMSLLLIIVIVCIIPLV